MNDQEPAKEAPRTILGFLKFTLLKIREKKKYYLFPLWILLVAVALLLLVSGNAHLLPAIYIAF